MREYELEVLEQYDIEVRSSRKMISPLSSRQVKNPK